MDTSQLSAQLAALQRGGNKASGVVNELLQKFGEGAEKTGVPQVIGGIGALGGAGVGAAIGGLGNFFKRSLQGKGLDAADLKKDMWNTMKSTSDAGYDMAKQGAISAPLANSGKVVSGAMAIPNAMAGINDLSKGKFGLDTGMKLGSAALGAYGAATQPNWLPGGAFQKQIEALTGKLGIPGAGTSRPIDLENFDERAAGAHQNLEAAKRAAIDSQMQRAVDKANGVMEFSTGEGANYPNTDSPGIDTGSNYGQNLMQNDGGAQPSTNGAPWNESYKKPMFQFDSAGNDLLKGDDTPAQDAAMGGYTGAKSYPKMDMSQYGEAVKASKSGTPPIVGAMPANNGQFGGHENWHTREASLLLNNNDEATYKAMQDVLKANSGDVEKAAEALKSNFSGFVKSQNPSVDLSQVNWKSMANDELDDMNFTVIDPGAQPGKWQDAYKRPMDAGESMLGGGEAFPKNSYGQMDSNLPSGKVSTPRLTPSQQGAVSKLINAAKARMGGAIKNGKVPD